MQEADGTKALLITARDELVDTIKMMLYGGLKPDAKYIKHVTAMVATSQNGHLEAVNISAGYETNSAMLANSEKTTAFIRASRSGQVTVVKVLLKKDLHFDEQKTDRYTDMMVAAMNGHAEIVKILIK